MDTPLKDVFSIESLTSDEGVLLQYFELTDSLSILKGSLEKLWKTDLSTFSFRLQDNQTLEENLSLRDQGIEGTGKVQIRLQVKRTEPGPVINILDVLKPSDEPDDEVVELKKSLKWKISSDFLLLKKTYHIPDDLMDWNNEHVKRWIHWCSSAFQLSDADLKAWDMPGAQVANMSVTDVKELMPSDTEDYFSNHVQILQKKNQVMVCVDDVKLGARSRQRKLVWKFLLDLLTDRKYLTVVQWENDDGEFRLLNPPLVAKLWGERTNSDNMTYPKFTRLIRYYYERMLTKVPGKLYAYKFLFDVKEMVGYSPSEFKELLSES